MEFNAIYDETIGKWYPFVDGKCYVEIGFDEPVTAHQVAEIIKEELNESNKEVQEMD